MRPNLTFILISTLCASACAGVAPVSPVRDATGPGARPDAVCAGLAPLVTRHAAALAVDGGPASLVTGDTLVRGFDAGCGPEAA